MFFDDTDDEAFEPITKEVTKVKERKNKSLSRKVAGVVLQDYLGHEYDGSDEYDEMEKELAKIIKKVIRRHDAGK